MPRTGGVYSPPAGTKGVPNTTVQSVPYNTFIDDLTADANAARPITAGGTGATSASAARTALGLAIGTNVQAYDAGLQSISGLTTAANQMIYTTALDVYATTALTPFARTILDDADAATVRATIGANNGSNINAGTVGDAFLPATMAGKTFTGHVQITGNFGYFLNSDSDRSLNLRTAAGVTQGVFGNAAASGANFINVYDAAGNFLRNLVMPRTGSMTWDGSTVWTAANDGPGSGMDADTVDGVQLAALVQTSRTLTAGNGLTGLGDLSANRTVALGTPSPITNSTTDTVTATSHTHSLGFVAAEVYQGSTAAETNYPVGHSVLGFVDGSFTNNQTIAVRIVNASGQYFHLGGTTGTLLSGTWKSRGIGSTGVGVSLANAERTS